MYTFCGNKETGETARTAAILIKVSGKRREPSFSFSPHLITLAVKIASAPQSEAMFSLLAAQGCFLVSDSRYSGEI